MEDYQEEINFQKNWPFATGNIRGMVSISSELDETKVKYVKWYVLYKAYKAHSPIVAENWLQAVKDLRFSFQKKTIRTDLLL